MSSDARARTRRRMRPQVLSALVIALLLSAAGGGLRVAAAQEAAGDARVQALAQSRQAAEQAHLRRVAAWGALNAAGGLALVLSTSRAAHPARWGFGLQSGLWGAVNLGIALPGLLGGPGDPASAFQDALGAERTLHDILLLNMGLNVAYAGVGTAMVVAGYRDVRSARSWRGHGTALVIQGAGLFVLDGVALLASRTRLADLLRLPEGIVGALGPGGFVLSVPL